MIPVSNYRKTRLQLVNRALMLAGDVLGEKYGKARAGEVVNDVVLDFSVKIRGCKDSLVVQMVEDQFLYNLPALVEVERGTGSVPRLFGSVMRIVKDGLTFVAGTNRQSFFRTGRGGWAVDIGSAGNLAVLPHPTVTGSDSGVTGNLTVQYYGLPEYMDSEADKPDSALPSGLDDAICYGAAARLLYEGDNPEDLEKAVYFDGKYLAAVRDLRRSVSRAVGDCDDVRPG